MFGKHIYITDPITINILIFEPEDASYSRYMFSSILLYKLILYKKNSVLCEYVYLATENQQTWQTNADNKSRLSVLRIQNFYFISYLTTQYKLLFFCASWIRKYCLFRLHWRIHLILERPKYLHPLHLYFNVSLGTASYCNPAAEYVQTIYAYNFASLSFTENICRRFLFLHS